jgi:3-hydroxybutyryl-CoA dehydrogenase
MRPALALNSQTDVAVIGAGTMGAGIAQVAAVAGHRVRLYDTRAGAAETAITGIRVILDKLATKQRLTAKQARAASARLAVAGTPAALAGCGLLVEAIVENLDAKCSLFCELETQIADDAILATNTSSISVTAIGARLRRPERLAGLHFFNPAPLMPLVEIISGAVTAPKVADMLSAMATAWGKVPVRSRSTPGFIVNRVARPFYAEGLRLLNEGAADVATLDAIMRETGGFRMGPFELMDLIGHDVNYAVTRSVFDAYYGDPRFTPSLLQMELIDAGFLGRKSGRGFYDYREGAASPAPNTVARCAPPHTIRLYGDEPLSTALAARLTDAGVAFKRLDSQADGRCADADGAVLYRTDGRSATSHAAGSGIHGTVLVDLALDYARATRLALAAADQADSAAVKAAAGLLQVAGYAVSKLDDVPGMAVMRTVVMLANEAADAVNQGVCSAADVDLAMQKGVNYPCGPLAWADALGLRTVLRVLDHLALAYGEDRYRASPLLRRRLQAGRRFIESKDAVYG